MQQRKANWAVTQIESHNKLIKTTSNRKFQGKWTFGGTRMRPVEKDVKPIQEKQMCHAQSPELVMGL